MATAKPASTVRTRSSGSRGPGPGDQGPGIGRARWAGVGLVIAALLGAIGLAIVSPSASDPADPGSAIRPGADPSPAPSVIVQTPVAQPKITSPEDGWLIGEWYVELTADIPEDPLPRKSLKIAVYRDGVEVTRQALGRQVAGESVSVPDVSLQAGQNVLTVALVGPGGGVGPMSEAVTVTQDRDAPELTITSPESGSVTTEETIIVAGESEPGATVAVQNPARDFDREIGVGPSGTFEVSVRLAMGKNCITLRSTDQTTRGPDHEASIVVQRKDGRPVVDLQVPKKVARSDLSKPIRIVVIATDADGKPIEGATVSFALGFPGSTAQDLEDQTDSEGRVVWRVAPGASTSASQLTVTVDVIAPDGEQRQRSASIPIQ